MDFYHVKPHYIDYLKVFDTKVPNVSYTTKTKFVCGIVLEISRIEYFAPISSNVTPNNNCIIIKNSANRPISSIRFIYMIPITCENCLEKLNFDEISNHDSRYANLLIQEHKFCILHKSEILSMAKKVYRKGCNPNHPLHKLCCDFVRLERASLFWELGATVESAKEISNIFNGLQNL